MVAFAPLTLSLLSSPLLLAQASLNLQLNYPAESASVWRGGKFEGKVKNEGSMRGHLEGIWWRHNVGYTDRDY